MQQHSLLQTKLYVPPIRRELVSRPRLIERLNAGLQRKLTLVSAPAGFGKTTLVTQWLRGAQCPSTWLSLDESDNDPTRFLVYLLAALQTIEANIGQDILGALHSLQPLPTEAILTRLINEMAAIPEQMILVLDDYHLIQAQAIHDSLTFLLEYLPPHLHMVIASREDPPLPLARLRARGQLTEIRAGDLRFTPSESAQFLNQAMGLALSADAIAALEGRTEGWIAGLQLAALSMQGRGDTASLVQSFTGSHRYVLDYLVEEVLEQQSDSVQDFLLRTAILDRLAGSLCDAVRFGSAESPTDKKDSQAILEMLDRANLFIVPLDNERRWYRYHHLFADLLRLRLQQWTAASIGFDVAELHIRASEWYEDHGLAIEAFHHATAANDVERAERLIEGEPGIPLPFRGAFAPVLNWLESLPTTVLDASPSLWVTYAAVSLFGGGSAGVEEKLQAAEAALAKAGLQDSEPGLSEAEGLDDKTRDLIGRIASTRANLALGHRQTETLIAQSRRALEYLHPDNLTYRTASTWQLGVAYEYQGDRAAATRAYSEAIASSQAAGNLYTQVLATTGLGNIQMVENQLLLAAETFQRVLQLIGDLPIPADVHIRFCLAQIHYEWNDLAAAQQHGEQSLQLAEPYKDRYDIAVANEVLLARLKLVQGDLDGAMLLLNKAGQSARQHNFVDQIPEVAAAQVLILLRQGKLASAAALAMEHKLPLSQARVHLAQGNPSAALAALEPVYQRAKAEDLADEQLQAMILKAIALEAHGQKEQAVQLLVDALPLAEPGGFVRIFVDEGPPMARLLYETLSQVPAGEYVQRLLAAFPDIGSEQAASTKAKASESEWVEPLSERELEVLHLIAEGLTNREIASRLFLALNTVKAHCRNIYGKLNVRSRTQAIAKAQALGLLPGE